jgi:outer membrane protein assembly factor BamB
VVFTRDDQAVILSHGNSVSAFNWANGALLWTFPTAAPTGAPGVAPDGTIVFGNDLGRIYGLNPSGTQKWLRFASGEVRAAPAFGLAGEVYVGSYDFSLYAFTTATGSPIWSFFSSHWLNSPPSVGHDGRIYFHNRIGDLYCLSSAGTFNWMRKLGDESRGPLTVGPDSTLYVPYAGNTASGMAVIRQDAPTLFFNPVSFNQGISGVGDPEALRFADGITYSVESGTTQPLASEIYAEFETFAPKAQLDNLTVDVKLTAFGSGNLIFVPQIYDFANNNWQSVTKRPLVPGTPLTLSLLFAGNPSNAVDPFTKMMRVRFTVSRFARPTGQWGLSVDRLSTRIVPKF